MLKLPQGLGQLFRGHRLLISLAALTRLPLLLLLVLLLLLLVELMGLIHELLLTLDHLTELIQHLHHFTGHVVRRHLRPAGLKIFQHLLHLSEQLPSSIP